MAGERKYRYMPSPKLHARWTDARCECGAAGPNLDGAHFEGLDVRQAVCLDCLEAGKVARDLDDRREVLKAALKAKNKAWGAAKINAVADERTAELARTPPVPWLRKNEWPVCCDDFAVYRGEWARREWRRAAKDGDGQAAIARTLGGDADRAAELWKDLPEEPAESARAAAFVFQCAACKKVHLVEQRR